MCLFVVMEINLCSFACTRSLLLLTFVCSKWSHCFKIVSFCFDQFCLSNRTEKVFLDHIDYLPWDQETENNKPFHFYNN